MKEVRPRISEAEYKILQRLRKPREESRVLAIGDLHEPFCLPEYLPMCVDVYKRYRCNRVVFIGDIVDNHYSSYHEADPDGFSGGDELDLAIFKLKAWYEAFPVADWIIGNHDRLIGRKAMTAGISKRWVRDYNQVLQVYNWKMHERLVIDGVQYLHGEGGTARSRAKSDLFSTIQGHLHTQAYTEFFCGANYKIFGSQIGCGIDATSYAMAYAKNFKKPAIGVMVIVDGKHPVNLLMDL
jgi:hypothetical protein